MRYAILEVARPRLGVGGLAGLKVAPMRFAVGVPNVREYGDPRVIRDLAVEAEAAGWDGVFVWDHLLYHEDGSAVADPWIALGAIAQATSTIRFGVMVAALARRRPWKVARETATLDLLSGGRLVFGAGLGSIPGEFSGFGEDPDARVRAEKLDEGLEIVTRLWSGERVEFHGKHYEISTGPFLPAPGSRIPLWIAGRWPNRRPFRRAARWDGIFATHAGVGWTDTITPAQLAEIVDYTKSHRDDGRGDLDVVMEGISAGPGEQTSIEDHRRAGLTWWVEKLGWFRGSIDEMVERVRLGPPGEAGPASTD
jgi:alkanesulfonate monooxygenase SsuD/methylene tetrahydromethanopterin reductase-like flavin-dependent oxidoreductase (luciferase family)